MKDTMPKVGQVYWSHCYWRETPLDRQVALPDWHDVTRELGYVRLYTFPCIKLCLNDDIGDDGWEINTEDGQAGLVCYLPKTFYLLPVTGVQITRVMEHSVSATPIAYIACAPPAGVWAHGFTVREFMASFRANGGNCMYHEVGLTGKEVKNNDKARGDGTDSGVYRKTICP